MSTKPTITTQHTMAKVNEARAAQARANRLSQFAIPLGCVLRDKFDFSDVTYDHNAKKYDFSKCQQFTMWADLTWAAAEAFVAKEQELVDPLNQQLMEVVNEHNELVQIEAAAAGQQEANNKKGPARLRALPDPVEDKE